MSALALKSLLSGFVLHRKRSRGRCKKCCSRTWVTKNTLTLPKISVILTLFFLLLGGCMASDSAITSTDYPRFDINDLANLMQMFPEFREYVMRIVTKHAEQQQQRAHNTVTAVLTTTTPGYYPNDKNGPSSRFDSEKTKGGEKGVEKNDYGWHNEDHYHDGYDLGFGKGYAYGKFLSGWKGWLDNKQQGWSEDKGHGWKGWSDYKGVSGWSGDKGHSWKGWSPDKGHGWKGWSDPKGLSGWSSNKGGWKGWQEDKGLGWKGWSGDKGWGYKGWPSDHHEDPHFHYHVGYEFGKDLSCVLGLLGFKSWKDITFHKFFDLFKKLKYVIILGLAFKLGLFLSPVTLPLLLPVILVGALLVTSPLLLITYLLFKVLKTQLKLLLKKKGRGNYMGWDRSDQVHQFDEDFQFSKLWRRIDDVTLTVAESEACMEKVICKINKGAWRNYGNGTELQGKSEMDEVDGRSFRFEQIGIKLLNRFLQWFMPTRQRRHSTKRTSKELKENDCQSIPCPILAI